MQYGFLAGDDIDLGLENVRRWLKKGGKIYIIVMSSEHIAFRQQVLPEFEKRKKNGDPWPGMYLDGPKYLPEQASALHDKLKAFFNKLLEGKKTVEESVNMKSIQKADMAIKNLLRNIATNSNIPTDEKSGLINALGELQDFVDEVGFDSEVEQDEYASDYSKRRQSELSEESVRMFKSDNPEGDKLVLNFLKRIAKDFNYPVQQAALFVKERIKKLGY